MLPAPKSRSRIHGPAPVWKKPDDGPVVELPPRTTDADADGDRPKPPVPLMVWLNGRIDGDDLIDIDRDGADHPLTSTAAGPSKTASGNRECETVWAWRLICAGDGRRLNTHVAVGDSGMVTL